MRKLVLNIQRGGLGDHLFYSHLPRIAKQIGVYDQVWISNQSIFRHPDNKKIIWEHNPYIDGFTDETGIYHHTETNLPAHENLLDRLMLLYGLDDGHRFHEPEIYYQPPHREEWKDLVIYDPNYISYTGDLAGSRLIEAWFHTSQIRPDYQMRQLNRRYLPLPEVHNFGVGSLTEFCSLLVSCKKMICLSTGTGTLAAALGIPVTVLYGTGLKPVYRHSNMHEYIHLGSDYRLQHKVKKQLVLLLGKYVKLGVS